MCSLHFLQSYSGSALGHIHHLDPRAPAPLVGATVQKDGICSLQWSPGGDWLASGSTEGLLCIWDSEVTGLTRPRQPITTMKQPSAVKVCLTIGALEENENTATCILYFKFEMNLDQIAGICFHFDIKEFLFCCSLPG